MKINKSTGFALLAGAMLVVGTVGGGVALAQTPQPTTPEMEDQVESPGYSGSIVVNQVQTEGMSEADEAAALQDQAGITANQAKATAEAANPGQKATKVELDNENGVLVYSVELDGGLEVKVDAGDGSVLHTEQAGAEDEASEADDDDVQEEVEQDGQPDDANEAPESEDAPAQ